MGKKSSQVFCRCTRAVAERRGIDMGLTVHDEIVLECPEAQVREATRVLKQAMMQGCREYLTVVAIPEPEVLVEEYWAKG